MSGNKYPGLYPSVTDEAAAILNADAEETASVISPRYIGPNGWPANRGQLQELLDRVASDEEVAYWETLVAESLATILGP